MYDSVMVDCPGCGARVEFQSKGGNCGLDVYSPDSAPEEVLLDTVGDKSRCNKCGVWMASFMIQRPTFEFKAVRGPTNEQCQGGFWRPDEQWDLRQGEPVDDPDLAKAKVTLPGTRYCCGPVHETMTPETCWKGHPEKDG